MYLHSHHGQGDFRPYSGIKIEPMNQESRDVKIIYSGLLAKSGAEHVYLHAGFGKRRGWEKVSDQLMENTARGWEKTIIMDKKDDQLNFCFKDCANNWDNNHGENWTYVLTD